MKLANRLRRVLLVIAVTFAAAFFCSFFWLMFYIFSAIAFSGSTGTEHSAFFEQFKTVPHALAGAVAFGGLMAMINAAAVDRGYRFSLIAAAALTGAVYSIVYPPLGVYLSQLSVRFFQLVGVAGRPPY